MSYKGDQVVLEMTINERHGHFDDATFEKIQSDVVALAWHIKQTSNQIKEMGQKIAEITSKDGDQKYTHGISGRELIETPADRAQEIENMTLALRDLSRRLQLLLSMQ